MDPELKRELLIKGRTQPPKVLIASSECSPLSKTGGLADMAGALPKALAPLGVEARVITPYHRCVKERYGARVEHMCYFYIDLGWRRQYVGLEKLEIDGLTAYLIDSEYYFGDAIYRGGMAEVEQYAFFQRAVLEAIPRLDFAPEVLHCNDWQTGMLPFLLRTQYWDRPQGALKTILTIHNIAFQGWLPLDAAGDMLGVDSRWYGADGIGHWDTGNFLKAGCLFADKVNTVSPSYAGEICTPEFGEGLQEVLRWRGWDLSGVLNGIDVTDFDPATDGNIPCHFDAEHPEDKAKAKAALIEELGLSAGADTPLIGMVTRMTPQKGFDLVLSALDRLMEDDVCFVLLGTGDARYQDAMRDFERRYPGRVCAYIGYSEALARRIYAGADFFLMPSAFEPCGLSQMIAQRYGALPIVHEVGGLRDTVKPYNCLTGEGDGFSFYDFNSDVMLGVTRYALETYKNKDAMQTLIRAAMTRDVSLNVTAVEYAKLYAKVAAPAPDALYHASWDERCRSPLGALKCGERVTLRLKAPESVERAELVASCGTYPMARDADGYFSADLTAPAEPGLVWYSFALGDGVSFGKNGLGTDVRVCWQITVYAPDFETPGWAAGAVMYQIFPDRYAPGGDSFTQGVLNHRRRGRHIELHESWDEPAKYLPTTREHYYPDDFFGGTLAGIRQKLPELKALGVNCLYLNPIFEADSNHRYNTADYMHIDPMLGTEDDFRELCSAASEQGVRIILDGVFSHTGDDSVYFNRPGHYEAPGAYQGPESLYYSWFDFRSFPDDYRSWWGFQSLPEVNETDPKWQEFVVSGENSVMKKWLRAGASGWRLDVADELPDEVIDLMRESVKSEDPEAFLLGEVWEDATNKVSYGSLRRYALGKGLDSVMNYPLRSAFLDFALYRSGAEALRDFLLMQKLHYPPPMYRCLMNLLGSHDTARLRTILGSGLDGEGMSREEQAAFVLTAEQNARGKALQRLGAALQFTLPGIPCVYYGDEEGMQGFRDPFCRESYKTAPEGESLRALYASLARLRGESELLRRGDAAFAACGADTALILRYAQGKAALIAVNRGESAVHIAPRYEDFRGLRAADAEGLPPLPALEIPALDFAIVKL